MSLEYAIQKFPNLTQFLSEYNIAVNETALIQAAITTNFTQI
jgi:hypothetical protein